MPPLNSFLKRVITNNELKYDADGTLKLLKAPGILFSLSAMVIMQDFLKKEFGEKWQLFYYELLKIQSQMAARMMRDRFGFTKENGIKQQIGHASMIGAGILNLERADIKNDEFYIRASSTYALETRNVLGLQKEPVDVFLRGGLTGVFQEWCKNKDMICIERSCIAMGKKSCEFEIKDKSKFDLKDPFIAGQIPPKTSYDFEKLYGKLGFPIR